MFLLTFKDTCYLKHNYLAFYCAAELDTSTAGCHIPQGEGESQAGFGSDSACNCVNLFSRHFSSNTKQCPKNTALTGPKAQILKQAHPETAAWGSDGRMVSRS